MNGERIRRGVDEILRQGLVLLDGLDDESYTARHPVAFHASIGGHYRHCLDHFAGLLQSRSAGLVDYDCRRRDEKMETNRLTARGETLRLLRELGQTDGVDFAVPLRVRNTVGYDGGIGPEVSSTWGRELMHATTHAIHHYALIAVLCGLGGIKVPSGFGVAPSTLKHQQVPLPRSGT